MRTIRFTLLALMLTAAPLSVSAQPVRPDGLSEREYQNKKKELREQIRDLEAEHSRYDAAATKFEGIWKVSGTMSSRRRSGSPSRIQAFSGELVLTRISDKGKFEVEGRLTIEGQSRSRPWKAEGAVTADGKFLETKYAAKSFAGVGDNKWTLRDDGSLSLSFVRNDEDEDEARGDAIATRKLGGLTKAELETKLFEVNHELQFLRYRRPEPLRYRARSRNLRVDFTPTVEWDPNGVEQQVVDMIGKAKHTIDLCVFEFSLMRVARALVQAKKDRGVKIRMVYDDREEEQPAVQLLRDNQIAVRSDERTALMHNKFMVIDYGKDSEIVWSGSTNLAAGGIYIADNHALTFRNKKLGQIYHTEFEEMFVDGAFGPTSPQNTSNEWVKLDSVSKVQIFFAPEDDPMKRLIEVVKGAKKSIRIMAFAFTSVALFDAIKERMESEDKVKVEGVFESRHAGWKDIKIGPLHALGAKVRFDENPNAMHHKVLIIDDKIVISGSFNFTDSATSENDENMIVLDSRSAAKTFVREFRRIMGTTDPDDPRIATSGMAAEGMAEAVDRSTDDEGDDD